MVLSMKGTSPVAYMLAKEPKAACFVRSPSVSFTMDLYCVEVGRVWLELPNPVQSYKPNTSSIRKPSSTRIIIPSTCRPIYIYILGLWYRNNCE